jgi:hypothetical protein
MISHNHARSDEEEISQTQNSETGSDLKEDQTVPCASLLDISQKNIKEFPTYLYEKCFHVKVSYKTSL